MHTFRLVALALLLLAGATARAQSGLQIGRPSVGSEALLVLIGPPTAWALFGNLVGFVSAVKGEPVSRWWSAPAFIFSALHVLASGLMFANAAQDHGPITGPALYFAGAASSVALATYALGAGKIPDEPPPAAVVSAPGLTLRW